MHDRLSALNNWLMQALDSNEFHLKPLTGDASFRRYFRVSYKSINRLVMDAPPQKESLNTFIEIANFFRAYGLLTPKIYAVNELEGFALIDDFGDQLFSTQLTEKNANQLYIRAIEEILRIQQCPLDKGYRFPEFDAEFMHREMNLFREWFLNAYLNMKLTAQEEQLLCDTFDWLASEIIKQPQVVIHRDYHSRNLLLTGKEFNHQLAIIDFQDAMLGPVTYDLVSLLKDCYVQWPRESVIKWLTFFYNHSTYTKTWDFNSFLRAFDLCGLQRHIKVAGIFCRLYLRDGKSGYLKDLPLVLHYLMSSLEIYEELQSFYLFMQQRVKLP